MIMESVAPPEGYKGLWTVLRYGRHVYVDSFAGLMRGTVAGYVPVADPERRSHTDQTILVRLIEAGPGYRVGETIAVAPASCVPLPHVRVTSTGGYRISGGWAFEGLPVEHQPQWAF